jgi:hypothetical protein
LKVSSRTWDSPFTYRHSSRSLAWMRAAKSACSARRGAPDVTSIVIGCSCRLRMASSWTLMQIASVDGVFNFDRPTAGAADFLTVDQHA